MRSRCPFRRLDILGALERLEDYSESPSASLRVVFAQVKLIRLRLELALDEMHAGRDLDSTVCSAAEAADLVLARLDAIRDAEQRAHI